jgi:hypothetical protein
MLLRKDADPGIRVWLLNHQPDQALIVNPFKGLVEQKFLVADGLRELAFSRDFKHAYVASVVDVSNRVKVIDTRSYLQEDKIDVDGIPQAIGVFPDDKKLAVILGSKTDFMAGGFDVLDLTQRSTVDPHRRKRLYRERDLSLTHKLHVGDDGDRIYVIDAKRPLVNIFSLKAKKQIGAIDLHGAPEEMVYPQVGDFYYVCVLQHQAIYQFDKETDQVVAAYVTEVMRPKERHIKKIKFMCVDKDARYLFGTSFQSKTVYIWEIGNPDHKVDWPSELAQDEDPDATLAELESFRHVTEEHYTPKTTFKMKGGYDANKNYLPEPTRVAVDSLNQNLFVLDADGALFLYNFNEAIDVEEGTTLEPYKIVPGTEGQMRDMKISEPAVKTGAAEQPAGAAGP